METIYYNLDARRVSLCDMASGEAAPVRKSYTVLRKVENRAGGGKVLDMAAYRRKLEGDEEDWQSAENRVADAPLNATAVPATRRARHTHIFGLTLDTFATIAILVMAAVVITAFLPFL